MKRRLGMAGVFRFCAAALHPQWRDAVLPCKEKGGWNWLLCQDAKIKIKREGARVGNEGQ